MDSKPETSTSSRPTQTDPFSSLSGDLLTALPLDSNVSEALPVEAIPISSVLERINSLENSVIDQHDQFTETASATNDILNASPSQRRQVNRTMFRDSARILVERFLPNRRDPEEFIEILRGTSPRERVAWSELLNAIAEHLQALIEGNFRPAVEQLRASLNSGDMSDITRQLDSIDQGIDSFDVASRALGSVDDD